MMRTRICVLDAYKSSTPLHAAPCNAQHKKVSIAGDKRRRKRGPLSESDSEGSGSVVSANSGDEGAAVGDAEDLVDLVIDGKRHVVLVDQLHAVGSERCRRDAR